MLAFWAGAFFVIQTGMVVRGEKLLEVRGTLDRFGGAGPKAVKKTKEL